MPGRGMVTRQAKPRGGCVKKHAIRTQVSRRNALVKKASLEETRATHMGGFSPRGPATSRLILAGPPVPKIF